PEILVECWAHLPVERKEAWSGLLGEHPALQAALAPHLRVAGAGAAAHEPPAPAPMPAPTLAPKSASALAPKSTSPPVSLPARMKEVSPNLNAVNELIAKAAAGEFAKGGEILPGAALSATSPSPAGAGGPVDRGAHTGPAA